MLDIITMLCINIHVMLDRQYLRRGAAQGTLTVSDPIVPANCGDGGKKTQN
ncbi:MAG: hypothetical protein P4M05_02050 [Bradyrhizobium sp.]|nr:hypothetical protein [Bradyrhizobium sp.]